MQGSEIKSKTFKLKSCKLTGEDLLSLQRLVNKHIILSDGENTKIDWEYICGYSKFEIKEQSLTDILESITCPPRFNSFLLEAKTDKTTIGLYFTRIRAFCNIVGKEKDIKNFKTDIELFIEARKNWNFIFHTVYFFALFGVIITTIIDSIISEYIKAPNAYQTLLFLIGIFTLIPLVLIFPTKFPYSYVVIKDIKISVLREKLIYPTIVSILSIIVGIIVGKII